VVSTVVVANQSATGTTFRISVAVAGAADALSQYIAYNVSINGNETIGFTLGITMGATDVMRCYAAAATLTFSAFGQQNS
jgi:hypothetical protein